MIALHRTLNNSYVLRLVLDFTLDRGPHFFNADLTLMKNFRIPKWEAAEFQIGAQAFNVLNHPNFDQSVANLADPNFGHIIRTVATPTSIFGSFLGGDASPRALQLRAQLRF